MARKGEDCYSVPHPGFVQITGLEGKSLLPSPFSGPLRLWAGPLSTLPCCLGYGAAAWLHGVPPLPWPGLHSASVPCSAPPWSQLL